MTKQFSKNKVTNFKAAKHRVIKTNNPFIGMFGRSIVTEAVNNKGLNNNPRYNPDSFTVQTFIGNTIVKA